MAKKGITKIDKHDDDFSFEETPIQELPLQEKKSTDEASSTLLMSMLGGDMLKWMAGEQEAKPEELKKLGDDLANRMNWFLACSAVSMLESVPQLLKKKRSLEGKLDFEVEGAVDRSDILILHRSISVELKEILEYSRRFIKENKDFLTDNSDFFDRQLFEGIKAMSSELKNDYLMFFTIIEKRGHNLLKELIKKYRD